MQKLNLCIFLMVLTASVWGQGVPISQLPSISNSFIGTLDTSAVIPVVQDSVPGKKKTYKATIADIRSITVSDAGVWSKSGNAEVDYPSECIGSLNGGITVFSSGNPSNSGNVAYLLAHRSEPGIIGSIELFDNDSIYEEATRFGTTLIGEKGKILTISQGSYDGDTSASINILKDSIYFEFVKDLGYNYRYTFPNYVPLAGQILGAIADNGHLDWITPSSFTPSDSITIYSLAPTAFTTYACTDCTGNGITGAVVSFFGGLWRRLKFD